MSKDTDLPAERAKKGLCPETGESLEGKDIEARAETLWPERTLARQFLVNGEAKRRKALLLSLLTRATAKE